MTDTKEMTEIRESNQGSASLHLHQGQPVLASGQPLSRASAVVIMLHGRGATARGILALADELDLPKVAYLAPQAQGMTWYPYSFLAPISKNEPALSSALRAVSDVLEHVRDAGLPAERVVLLGFSQGACLCLEHAARHPVRYGGVIAFSGGLIGTGDKPGVRPPADKHFDYEGSLQGTPVFTGCSDVDPHIPLTRVETSVAVLRSLGGEVTERIYDGMDHTINPDELNHARSMISLVAEEPVS